MLAALGLSLQRVLSHLRGDTEKSQPRKIAKTATRHTFPCTTIMLTDSNAYRSSMLIDPIFTGLDSFEFSQQAVLDRF
jgi:hypothetical protein